MISMISSWRCAALLLGLLCLEGCALAPDLRVVDQEVPPASIAEGKGFLEQGRAAEAVTAFRRLLREDGPDLKVLNGLAIAYSELGRPDLAAETFARALALSPDDPATLNNIGFSALRRGDVHLARRYLERARMGGADVAEIEGNLAGLDLLETIERRDTSLSATPRAASNSWQRPSARVVRLALSADARQATLSDPSSAMIDFIAVIDPFSNASATERFGR